MQFLSHSTQETEAIGEELAQSSAAAMCSPSRARSAWGKTAFTRGLARGLGCRGRVWPDVHHRQRVRGQNAALPCRICTASARRTSCSTSAGTIISPAAASVPSRWSERVSDALPEDTIFVDIARTDEHEDWRTITVTGGRFA